MFFHYITSELVYPVIYDIFADVEIFRRFPQRQHIFLPIGDLICAPQPEQEVIRKETLDALIAAFEELTDKEQDVIGMHLGFCHKCHHPEKARTYDEIADVYQFSTEDGVRRFYQRTLDKLRLLLETKSLLYCSVEANL